MAYRSGEMGRLTATNAAGEMEGNVQQPLQISRNNTGNMNVLIKVP